jgi:hypothetical protein
MAKKNLYVLTGRSCDGVTDSWVVKAKRYPHLEKVVEKVFDPTAYCPHKQRGCEGLDLRPDCHST